MKKMIMLALVVAAVCMTSCCAQNEPKFDAKEYAKFKTEKLDKLVELTDAQEKDVYALYLEQGKQIKKGIKEMKKEGCGQKKPACTKPACDKKAECTKGECGKPACDKKAECKKKCAKKAECGKAECKKECTKKAECAKECKKGACEKVNCEKKAECTKECKKAECNKANCDKKAECTKAECSKPACDKKAECKKDCAKKAECHKAKCDKPAKPRHPRMVNPAEHKAFFEKMNAILTPEQVETLKTKMMERRARRGVPSQAPQCAPSCPSQQAK